MSTQISIQSQLALPYQNPFLLYAMERVSDNIVCDINQMLSIRAAIASGKYDDYCPPELAKDCIERLDKAGPKAMARFLKMQRGITEMESKKKVHVRWGMTGGGKPIVMPKRLRVWALFDARLTIPGCHQIWASWGFALHGEHSHGAPDSTWLAEPAQTYANPKHIMIVEWFRRP